MDVVGKTGVALKAARSNEAQQEVYHLARRVRFRPVGSLQARHIHKRSAIVRSSVCLTGLAGTPIRQYPAGHDVREDPVESVANGVGVAIDGDEDLQ